MTCGVVPSLVEVAVVVTPPMVITPPAIEIPWRADVALATAAVGTATTTWPTRGADEGGGADRVARRREGVPRAGGVLTQRARKFAEARVAVPVFAPSSSIMTPGWSVGLRLARCGRVGARGLDGPGAAEEHGRSGVFPKYGRSKGSRFRSAGGDRAGQRVRGGRGARPVVVRGRRVAVFASSVGVAGNGKFGCS